MHPRTLITLPQLVLGTSLLSADTGIASYFTWWAIVPALQAEYTPAYVMAYDTGNVDSGNVTCWGEHSLVSCMLDTVWVWVQSSY